MAIPIRVTFLLLANAFFTAAVFVMYCTPNVALVAMSSEIIIKTYLWSTYMLDIITICVMGGTAQYIAHLSNDIVAPMRYIPQTNRFQLFVIRLGLIVSFCIWVWVAVSFLPMFIFFWLTYGEWVTVRFGLVIFGLKLSIPALIFYAGDDLLYNVELLTVHPAID